MQKNWSDIAWEDYLSLQSNKKLLKRVNEILKDIDRNGYKGIGKPEPLKGDFSGYWSDVLMIITELSIKSKMEKCILPIVELITTNKPFFSYSIFSTRTAHEA